ncbi:MAG: SOS response-associated peptidase [Akkermansiaceae bacterium]|nr:SOS response-associated peptidase [Akkermansiaceae bacterium]
MSQRPDGRRSAAGGGFSGCLKPFRWQILAMCNCYRIQPQRGSAKDLHEAISAAAESLARSLVRKSDPGVVVTAGPRVEVMRWGFHRSFHPAVNNARSDKLVAGMWAAAYRERRCVIPVTLFYEWGRAVAGRKPAFEFGDPAGDFLWVAGIWEEHPEIGRCYSMVTTAAAPLMAPIHDRMPAVLPPSDAAAFLHGGPWSFRPFAGPLTVTPCASPLARPQQPDEQPGLW